MVTFEILRLAGDQHGALSRTQLGELGVSRSAVSRAVADGRLVTVAPGVHRLCSAPETHRFWCAAATLFGDGCGFVSGFSAGRLRGLRKMYSERVHFTVPLSFRKVPPEWIELHVSRWYDPADREWLDSGIAIASPMRMLWGMAADFNQHRFDRAADDAWYRRLITPEEAARSLEAHRCRGKDGVLRLERWLERAMSQRAPSQSYLERELIDAVVALGVPSPVRQHPLVLPDGEVIHLDLAWPDIRFAVEPGHSWFHSVAGGQERDHQRDLASAEVGWHVLRLNETMLERRLLCARAVAVAYHQRRRDVRRPGSVA